MAEGWIALHKRISSHWVSQDRPYNMLAAWIDILIQANWRDGRTVIGRKVLDYKRGESLKSLDTWAERWGWNKSAVRRFLNSLEMDGMICTANETVTTRITICNYESYQNIRNGYETEVTLKRNASETEVTPEEQVNKETIEEENMGVPQAEPPVVFPKAKREKRVIEMPDMPESLKAIPGVPEAWENWKQHRKEKRNEITATTAVYQFRELLKSPNPLAMLEHSIAKGYSGLYDPKPMNGQAKQSTSDFIPR